MEQAFRDWLIQQGKPSAGKNYPQAINLVSEHYSKASGQKTNIYSITDQVLISEIAHDYTPIAPAVGPLSCSISATENALHAIQGLSRQSCCISFGFCCCYPCPAAVIVG